MSFATMDIAVSPSSHRKRKINEKDHRSSKKRKQHEDPTSTIVSVTPDAPLFKGKKKKARNEDKIRENSWAPAIAAIPTLSSPISTSGSKGEHKTAGERDPNSLPPSAQPWREEDYTSSSRPLSPLSRKPLAKASASLLATETVNSSPFYLITSTLYLPLSPISISPTHALPSLLAEHLSPLLLTYYPPLRGIVLAYSNPYISSAPPVSPTSVEHNNPNPQPLTLAVSANEYGVLYTYLTATFLIFRPERSQTLEGRINIQTEGLLGAVVFNLFSVGIERRRLPKDWKWVAPGQAGGGNREGIHSGDTSNSWSPTTGDDSEFDSDKENFRPLPPSSSGTLNLGPGPNGHNSRVPNDVEDEDLSVGGFFQSRSGRRVRGIIRFRVRDVDVIVGSERDKGFMSINGTMLHPEEEEKLVAEERKRTVAMRKIGEEHNSDKVEETRMCGAVTPHLDGREGGNMTSRSPQGVAKTNRRKVKRSRERKA